MLNRPSRQSLRLALFAALLLAIAVLYMSGVTGYVNLESLKMRHAELDQWIASYPLLSAAVYFLLYVTIAAASIPGAAIMTLAGGALFGLVTGTLLVSFASTIGATLAFLAARFLLRDLLRARYRDRLKKIDEGIRRDGAFYLFTLRLVPAVPFFLINLLAGLTALPARTFFWVSQLGMLPVTLAYVYAGVQLARIESAADVLSPGLIGALAALGMLPLLTRWAARWLAGRRIYGPYRRPRHFDYNLLVIGGGSAGLVAAYVGAAVRAKVALIEKHRMGGDCLNTGCVPSKALIRTARLLADARDSRRYGVRRMHAEFDFAAIMDRVYEVIRTVAPHDSAERYRSLGVDVIQAEARLVSPWEVEAGGRRLSARSIVIATGARPLVPPIPGLDSIDYLTSDSLWALRDLPRRLVVLGGGPIGCELAQCFARFGSKVSVVEMAPRLLPREDPDASAEIESRFRSEDLTVAVDHKALRVERTGDAAQLVCEHAGRECAIQFDRLLVALGRKASVAGFGLEELGVRLNERGTVEADALQRTNFPNILVAGDATGPFQFTHVAAHQAWYASINGLLAPFWRFTADYRVVPWATFTDPEVARVGLIEQEARERGIEIEITRYGIDDLDRAIADGADRGFVKVLTRRGTDTILGATIVGAHAAELIHEFVLAMKHGLGLNKILGTIHVYPTLHEANKHAAGTWRRAHAPAAALRMAERFFAWQRGRAESCEAEVQ